MKNLKIFAIALVGMAVLASCDNKNKETVSVATFENISLGADSINSYSTPNVYGWVSGDFGFTTGYSNTYGDYYYNFVVTSQKSNAFSNYTDQYHSAPGGAAAGNNYVVAYQETEGYESTGSSLDITYAKALAVIPGTYVTNTAYTASVIQNGNAYARAFSTDNNDYLKLTFTGYLAGVKMGSVDFYLADFRDGKSIIIKQWTYVDLTDLLIVDKISCKLESTDKGEFGINTPTYFCLDNFGAKN